LADPVSTDPAFSPNGKFIAYVKSWEVKPYDSRSEVRVVRLNDQGDVRFTEGFLARARSPVWSPDGELLAFLMLPGRDSASQEVWITPVSETGKAAAASTKISLPNTTYDSLAGWTTDNKIGLLFPSPTHAAIYTVPTSGGKATQVTPGEGFHPRWSPDGERIYFRHDRGDIAFVPASGGKVALLSQGAEKVVEVLPGGGNHISPDGKRIVFSGYKEGLAGVHLWTMPVTGGEPVRLAMKPGSDSRCPQWSPDGRWIAFISERALSDTKLDLNIYLVSSEGGEPRQLTHHTECYCQLLTWSPDGNTIAYTCTDGALRIIPVTQGEPQKVIKLDGLGRHDGLAWTPDGARLVYSVKGRIWTVAPGGVPSEINTGLDAQIGDLAISPDGRRIGFNASAGGDPELWFMEDFLSLVKGR
jgi:Tol biopolymer transport system component